MNAFICCTALHFRLGIRGKYFLITYYAVPLMFFLITGGIFTFIMPESESSLIQSMTVLGVSMGAVIGFPSCISEAFRADIRKVYKANGVSLYINLLSSLISSFAHLFIMSMIIFFAAPAIFGAKPPESFALHLCSLAVFIAVSLSVGCALGLAVKKQANITMLSQLIFLPSILLTGIMFPENMLPGVLRVLGKLLPAAWGNKLMLNGGFCASNLLPLAAILIFACALCAVLLKKAKAEN